MKERQSVGKWVVVAAIVLSGCSDVTSNDAQVEPTYDRDGRLRQIEYDSNDNGRPDIRVFMDGKRPLRSEIDADEDGRIERWEHFDAEGVLLKVGTASEDDGVEDTWSYPGDDGQVVRIERVTPKGQVWRRELIEGEDVTRIEEDSNRDGQMDRWETRRGGVVAELALDSSLSRGAPDRRLVYAVGGALERIEVDPEGDGTFEALQESAASPGERPR